MKTTSESNKLSLITKLGVFSVSLLVASSALYVYSPVIGSYADSREADVNLNVAPGIGIRASAADVSLNATVGSFVHSSVNVDVATNSQYGYTLTLEDKDSSSSMTATGISSTVTSDFSGKKTSTEMEDNTWGFSLDATDYYKVPTNGNPVALKRTNTVMTTDYETTAVDFGAKVGMNLTAGTYSDVVVFTAYVNGQDGKPTDGTTPDDPSDGTAAAMQDFSCSDIPGVNGSAMLVDSRDGNTYKVAKLADGKCWMTENLRIINKTISSADSDMESGSFTIPASSAISNDWTDLNQDFRVHNPENGYGVYYNWYTVTAGSGTKNMAIETSASSSICPKGWKLPSSSNTNSDYSALIDAYGGHYSTDIQGEVPNFVQYGGYVDNSGLWSSDNTGFYWGSTTIDDGHGSSIGSLRIGYYFAEIGYRPRYEGVPARCVAR